MPSCELCGKDADSLTKVKIEGAKLKACDSCKELGEEVETKSKQERTRKTKKKSRSSKRRNTKVLVDNYGERVKDAREDETLSINELADEMNIKSSVLKKIEREEFKPDKTLAQSLSQRLDIKLYTNPEAYDVESSTGDDRDATLGDVADIKE